jgi:hypothetical protein
MPVGLAPSVAGRVLVAAAAALGTDRAMAAEVRAGGYPDLTLTGYVRFLAYGGQLDDARQNGRYSRSPDFLNDTEFHVVAQGRSEETGIDYGATVELEADNDETLDTDET